MELTYIPFRKNTNRAGSIVFVEGESEIPFTIHRIYYIYGVGEGCRRGFHAHKNLKQVLFCIHGSCKLLLDDGKERAVTELNTPEKGLLIDRPIWREMFDFSPDAVLLVLASEHYGEADYIRDYNQFISYVEEKA